MSGEGCLAGDRRLDRISQADWDAALAGAVDAAVAGAAERHAEMIERLAARIQAGPPKRVSWQQPINTRDFSTDEKAAIVPLLMGLASSIRAGIGEAETSWPPADKNSEIRAEEAARVASPAVTRPSGDGREAGAASSPAAPAIDSTDNGADHVE